MNDHPLCRPAARERSSVAGDGRSRGAGLQVRHESGLRREPELALADTRRTEAHMAPSESPLPYRPWSGVVTALSRAYPGDSVPVAFARAASLVLLPAIAVPPLTALSARHHFLEALALLGLTGQTAALLNDLMVSAVGYALLFGLGFQLHRRTYLSGRPNLPSVGFAVASAALTGGLMLIALSAGVTPVTPEGLGGEARLDSLQWCLVFASNVLLPAVVEELAWRGCVLPMLCTFLPATAALATSSLMFALVHYDVDGGLGFLAAGLLFGAIRLRTNSTLPAISAHAAWSSIVLLASLGWPSAW